MKTIDLDEAAIILKAHKETVRLKAKRGEIPGRKVGKRWIFSQLALARYLAGEWTPRVVEGKQEEDECHSTNEVVVQTGISSCITRKTESLYKEALAPRTNAKRRSSMTA